MNTDHEISVQADQFAPSYLSKTSSTQLLPATVLMQATLPHWSMLKHRKPQCWRGIRLLPRSSRALAQSLTLMTGLKQINLQAHRYLHF